MTDIKTPTTTDDINARLETVETQYKSIDVQLGEISQVLENLKPTEPKPDPVVLDTPKTDVNEPVFQTLYENAKADFRKIDKDIDLSKLDSIDIPAEKKIAVLKAFVQSGERTQKLVSELATLKSETVKGEQSQGGSPPNPNDPQAGPDGAAYLASKGIDLKSIKETL